MLKIRSSENFTQTEVIDLWLQHIEAYDTETGAELHASGGSRKNGRARRYFVWMPGANGKEQIFSVSAYSIADATDKANRKLELMSTQKQG